MKDALKDALLEPIKFGKPFPKAKVGDRVACWLVMGDDMRNLMVVRRLGPIVSVLGKEAVRIQDEAMIGYEEPFFVHRSMIYKPVEIATKKKGSKRAKA